jgi:hypothetical protein
LSAGSVLALLVSAATPTPVKRDTASTIWADIESTTTCAGCEVRVTALDLFLYI